MSDDRLSEQDQKRNEDPEKIAGAVGGATGAGLGAAAGVVLGPLGVVLGALAGTAGGWWAGQGVMQAMEDVDHADNRFRRAHEHAGATSRYEEVRHGYQLGYLAGRNPANADATFAELEEDLRTAWVKAHIKDQDPVPWEDVREHASRGYELAQERD